MVTKNSVIDELFQTVETLRDELEVQLHLAKADSKDEWKRLEKRYQEAKRKRGPVTETIDETAKGVWSGLEQSLEELRDGYRKLRDLI